ncbi:MAG: dihydrolipoamide acetyltransferase family protein [Candidatus Binatia bacterium]
MSIDVRMPKLSDSMESGVIIRWMKAPGDTVAKGDPLAEVETDKADVELEASASGVLREIAVGRGTTGTGGRGPSPFSRSGAAAAAAPTFRSAPSAAATSSPVSPAAAPGPAPVSPAGAPAGRVAAPPAVRASPLAWRMADAAGVDLSALRGSGPGGRILKRDVEMATRGGVAPAVPAIETPAPASADARQEVSRMRQAIARRMSEAKRDIPHFYVTAEVDMSEAMHLRESIRRREAMPGLTVTHLLVRALAIALVRHPHVNASWHDDGIEEHADVNIGIAVAVDDGLVVPVVHRVQTLTLGEIAALATALTEKARHGRFGGDDLTGATFSLSNVGMLDVEELTAVINPPNAAILAVGAVKDRPIVRGGQLAIAKTLRATLSCDHRVLNGLEGGRFLVELKSILENPVTLLLE